MTKSVTLREADIPGTLVGLWIGPGADDAQFDPQPGNHLTVIGEDGETLNGRVVGREDNRFWVQVEIPGLLPQSA